MLTEIVEGKLSAVIAENIDENILYNVLDFPNNGITNAQMASVLSDSRIAAFFTVGDIYICTDGGDYLINHQYKFTGEAWEDITPREFGVDDLPEGSVTKIKFAYNASKAFYIEFYGKVTIVDTHTGEVIEADNGNYIKGMSFLTGKVQNSSSDFYSVLIYGNVSKITVDGAEKIDASNCDGLKSISSTGATAVIFPKNHLKPENCNLPKCAYPEFPDGLLSIYSSTFSTTVKGAVELPETVYTLNNSFKNYNGDEIVFPTKFESMDATCFENSTVKRIIFKGNVPIITGSGNIFSTCSNLQTILVPAEYLAAYKNQAGGFILLADKIYPINGGYGETITIPTSAWTKNGDVYTATVTATGVTSNSDRCLVSWYVTDGTSKIDNIHSIECTTQGNKSLSFKASTLPVENIKVRVETTLTNY